MGLFYIFLDISILNNMIKISLPICALLFFSLVSCGPTSKNALAYNEQIMDIVNLATLSQNNFFDLTDGHNMDSLIIAQRHYSEATGKCYNDINRIDAFGGNKEYLNAAINFVKTLNQMADNEAKQMVSIMSKDTADVTEADIFKVKELLAKLEQESERTSKEVVDAQQTFSEEWKFEIAKEH